MTTYLPAIFSLLVSAAGWFYLFYSRAAQRLEGIEQSSANHLRQRLRRIGGTLMVLLGAAFYAGFYAVEQEHPTTMYLFVWLGVAVLLLAIVTLGLIDVHLTLKLRRGQKHDSTVN